jgi:hypothetical protein
MRRTRGDIGRLRRLAAAAWACDVEGFLAAVECAPEGAAAAGLLAGLVDLGGA